MLMDHSSPRVVVVGAGPAGLAAGFRLSGQGMDTLILERERQVGGLSRTIRHGGNCFDIGGHRFYTKDEAVLAWWRSLLGRDFLKVPRASRIYYKKRYFQYPIAIQNVVSTLGVAESALVLVSYLRARLFPSRPEQTLEEWLTNRFGRALYRTFFKEYSEKVWGLPCEALSADWAAERIKGASVLSALQNALFKDRGRVTTFIDEFDFPRLGAGMMYETAARRIEEGAGRILLNSEVCAVNHRDGEIRSVTVRDRTSGEVREIEASRFVSTMPITLLIKMLRPAAPQEILRQCDKLRYRSLVMVYLVFEGADLFKDNWIYVHSDSVHVARIQNFGNWSRDMVARPATTSLGMEYFCQKGDPLWSASDAALVQLAKEELSALGLRKGEQLKEALVVRVPDAYPVYDKGYREALGRLKSYVERFSNLHSVGRQGSFHYNSMDHAVAAGFKAAGQVMETMQEEAAVPA